MGLLFGRDDSDPEGCTGHHYSEYQEDWDSRRVRVSREEQTYQSAKRLKERIPVVSIEVPKVRVCQHEGCTEKEYDTFGNRYHIPRVLFESSISVRELHHALKIINGDYQEPLDVSGTSEELSEKAELLRNFADKIDPNVE